MPASGFRRITQNAVVWRRAAILLVLCIALAALAASDEVHGALLKVLAALKETIARHPIAGASLFVLAAAISAMLAFVSVAALVPAAVFAWGAPFSAFLLWVGWMLGGVFSYNIGRFLGRPVVRWLVHNPALHRFERRVQRDTPFGLVLLFQLALPSELPGYALGLVRYRFFKYLLALGIAEAPYTIATVYLGASFVEGKGIIVLAVGLLLAVASVVAFYYLRKKVFAPSTRRGA